MKIIAKALYLVFALSVALAQTTDSTASIEKYPVNTINRYLDLKYGAGTPGYADYTGVHLLGMAGGDVAYYLDGVRINHPFSNDLPLTIGQPWVHKVKAQQYAIQPGYGGYLAGVIAMESRKASFDALDTYLKTSHSLVADNNVANPFWQDYFAGVNIPLKVISLEQFALRADMQFSEADIADPGFVEKIYNGASKINGRFRLDGELTKGMNLGVQYIFQNSEEEFYRHSSSAYPFWAKQGTLVNNKFTLASFDLSHTLTPEFNYRISGAYSNGNRSYSAQNGKHYNEWAAISRYLPWVRWAEQQGWYNRNTGEFTGIAEEEAFWRYYDAIDYGELQQDGSFIWDSKEKELMGLNSRHHTTWYYYLDETDQSIKKRNFDFDDYALYLADPQNPDYRLFGYWNEPISLDGAIDRLYPSFDILGNFQTDFIPWWNDVDVQQTQLNIHLNYLPYDMLTLLGGFEYQINEIEATDLQFLNAKPYAIHSQFSPASLNAYVSAQFKFDIFRAQAKANFLNYQSDHKEFEDPFQIDVARKAVDTESRILPAVNLGIQSLGALLEMNLGYEKTAMPTINTYFNNDLGVLNTPIEVVSNNSRLNVNDRIYFNIKSRIDQFLSANIAFYYQKPDNRVGSREVSTLYNYSFVSYQQYILQNKYKAQGIQFELLINPVDYMWLSSNLHFAESKGKFVSTDFALEGDYEFGESYRTQFDIPVDLRFTLGLEFSDNTDLLPFGRNHLVNGISAVLSGIWRNGTPYSPQDSRGNLIEINSERLPNYARFDMRLKAGFNVIDDLELSVFADVINVFNRKNVVYVYPNTGQPDNNGAPPVFQAINYANYAEYEYASPEAMHAADLAGWKQRVDSPQHYGLPRLLRIGLELTY
jgi:hypothetical protein